MVQTHVVALGPEWLKPDVIIEWLGPWALVGLALIVFAECGLLLGFFLPGDSLLFTAGLFVAQAANGQPGIGTPLWLVCVILVIAAFAGNVCGYYLGKVAGPAIFDKPKSKLFKPEHVVKTQGFFDKYGNRAIVMARFVPIVRTFITVMAGVGRMEAKRFFTYSLVGGVAWAAGVTLLGFFLGQFAFVRENIELMLILIVLLSVLPIIIEVIKARRESKRGAGHAPEAAPHAPGGYRADLRPSAPLPANHAEVTQPMRPHPGQPRPRPFGG
ncbi:DedA family protein [Pseudonocardia humida]|uniref:DedA family protein n=1 Tax=Pseudonocardia humida TaxID=2800819 RepID=A0ABT0ZXA6_9PSEU|nr:DedA family protein [Pseudonocardia humida]MCO1655372.1 DedA family protein [Pseudonocardia humida]